MTLKSTQIPSILKTLTLVPLLFLSLSARAESTEPQELSPIQDALKNLNEIGAKAQERLKAFQRFVNQNEKKLTPQLIEWLASTFQLSGQLAENLANDPLLKFAINPQTNLPELVRRDLTKEETDLLEEIQAKEEVIRKKFRKIISHVHLPNLLGEKSLYLLSDNTQGQIKQKRKPNPCTDRYQFQVLLTLNDDKSTAVQELLWIHYRPDLDPKKQPIQLFDNSGRRVSDPQKATKIVTTKKGVTAWPTMEAVDPNSCSGANRNPSAMNKSDSVEKNNSGPQKRNIAAYDEGEKDGDLKSVQGISGGALWAHDCEDFIDSDGEYGKVGKALLANMDSKMMQFLYDGSNVGDIKALCPKYQDFNEDRKKNFWVWMAASIAMAESSCNPEIKAKGINGTAAGLFQLHLGKTQNYCGGICGSINALDGPKNAVCGMNMLDWYTVSEKNSSNLVYWKGNYWQVLHPPQPGQRKVAKLLASFEACQ